MWHAKLPCRRGLDIRHYGSLENTGDGSIYADFIAGAAIYLDDYDDGRGGSLGYGDANDNTQVDFDTITRQPGNWWVPSGSTLLAPGMSVGWFRETIVSKNDAGLVPSEWVVLIIALAVFLLGRVQGLRQQTTARKVKLETRELVNQLNHLFSLGSTVAVSSEWKRMSRNVDLYTAVPFLKLARLGESEILPMLKEQRITHLLLTSWDLYTLLFLYGDLVTRIKTDKGYTAFRYEVQTSLTETAFVTIPNNRPSGIYIVIGETSNARPVA